MNYYVVEDSELAKRNQSLIGSCGSTEILYNAVLSVVFSAEAATEPILLPEAKNWCRIDDDTTDDVLVTQLIKAARTICENHANISFITRTVTAKINNGLGGFNLPYGPVTAITSVTLKDGTDIYDANFSIDDAYGSVYTVVYTAGYATLPENLRTAILEQIAFMYQSRGDDDEKSAVSYPTRLILNQVRSV